MTISEKIKLRLDEAQNGDTPTKGLAVDVYRAVGYPDTTKNGLSNRHSRLTLVDGRKGNTIRGNRDIDYDNDDYLVLLEKTYKGKTILYAQPSKLVGSGKQSMFGGNFIYSSDSRFPTQHPVKVFDRVE